MNPIEFIYLGKTNEIFKGRIAWRRENIEIIE